jgi:flavin reductase (DIM6/NTAB) family NADH-FMN oxidoreductase RutF
MACGSPFLIGIAAGGDQSVAEVATNKISLTFTERSGRQRLLGRIRLQQSDTVPFSNQFLHLFRPRGSSNRCLPLPRLWARYLQYAYLRWRTPNSPISMSARDVHAMCVFYVCPRPTGLVSVTDGECNNVFPMNLMGTPNQDYFCFALKSTTPVVDLIRRAGRLALSSVPVEHAAMAYSLGKNHNAKSVDMTQIPFVARQSATWQLPVPDFALRVRELQVETVRNLGSHTLFVARVVHDEQLADGPQFFLIHGMYQAWRERAAIS